MSFIEKVTVAPGVTVEAYYDQFPIHPDEWELAESQVRIVHSHPQYEIGGALGDYRPDRPEVDELEGKFWRPLFAYEHGLLRLSLGDFGDPWDSGQVGWIGVDPDFEGTQDEAGKVIEWAVETLDHYYAGDNYLFNLLVFDEVEDSSGTFTGDYDEGLSEAVANAQYLVPAAQRQALQAFGSALEAFGSALEAE